MGLVMKWFGWYSEWVVDKVQGLVECTGFGSSFCYCMFFGCGSGNCCYKIDDLDGGMVVLALDYPDFLGNLDWKVNI